jgi:hypothetical protein
MTTGPPFPPAAKEFVRMHMDEYPSVLASKINKLFDYPCTDRGVRELKKRL